jgi:hypothetical protein
MTIQRPRLPPSLISRKLLAGIRLFADKRKEKESADYLLHNEFILNQVFAQYKVGNITLKRFLVKLNQLRRHARACRGHPRLSRSASDHQEVVGRDKRRHDARRSGSILPETALTIR